MSIYAVVVWLMCGLINGQWWMQFACFAFSAYLMAELNNANALIRIYSRMVSCTFIALACNACFLFPSLRGAILQLCVIASMGLLFLTYQDKQSVGLTFYGFAIIGLGSMAFAHVFYYLPIIWILMASHLQTLSWRTFGASLLGVLTPYWVGSCWLVWKEDFTPFTRHFAALADFRFPFDYTTLSVSQLITFAVVSAWAVTGIIHYIRQHHGDKMRTRLLFVLFAWVDIITLVFLVVQPQHYDALIRMAIICTAPLMAHFIALTSTKVTNVAFITIVCLLLLLTGYNVWTASLLF